MIRPRTRPSGPGRRRWARCSGGWPPSACVHGGQRPRGVGPGAEQALFPGFSDASVRPDDPDLEEHRGNPGPSSTSQKKGVILKPLQGSGGKNVFKIGFAQGCEPQPDLRGGERRGLPDRAGLHARGGGGRCALLPDERAAATARRASTPRSVARRPRAKSARTSMCGGSGRGRWRVTPRTSARDRGDGAAQADPGRDVPGRVSISSATSCWRSTCSRRRAQQWPLGDVQDVDFSRKAVIEALEQKVVDARRPI
jgi:hypothetical protein